MIDFRYHLVSLIAVFLALALGILLGAGPLNQTIGDQLTGQVEDLREDRDRLRAELDLATLQLERRDEYLDAVAAETLGSRLEGRAVAVIVLPDANADDVADVRQRLTQAAATITAEVTITQAWTDPDAATFRSSFAGQLASYLEPPAGSADPTDIVLGIALGQALTRGDAEGEVVADAETLLDLLTSAEEPLVAVEDGPSRAANATVVVGPRPVHIDQDDVPEPDETRDDRYAAYIDLARGLSATGEGSVLAGSARTEHDLLAQLRAEPEAAEAVTTIDSVDTVPGRLSVPLALASAIAGTTAHYGSGLDAGDLVPESVYLPPPAIPEGPEDGAGGDDAVDGTLPEGDEPTDDAEADEDGDDAPDADQGAAEPGTAGHGTPEHATAAQEAA